MTGGARLRFTGFHVEGTARILCQDGGVGTVRMDPYHADTYDGIRQGINDGRFGCEAILASDCHIYRDYEGHLVYVGIVHVDCGSAAGASSESRGYDPVGDACARYR